MRIGSILMTVLALGIAAAAGLMSKTWLEQQRNTGAPVVIERSVATNKIVTAAQNLRFGQELGAAHLKEIDWPAANIPAGAFTSVAELIEASQRRVVLSAIEQNEPILKWKITGPGQRASLSALIEPGMKAVSVRVNDVLGVGGFVLPGDHVDVLLTKLDSNNQRSNDENRDLSKTFTDVILQHVRVLGVDQLADDRTEKPSVVKAVTLEVSSSDAQKLTLAATMGTLSLMLRPAGSTKTASAPRITANAIEYEGGYRPTSAVAEEAPAVVPPVMDVPRHRQVVVTRALRRFDYTVPFDGDPQ
jgi:pilus assembly protein CpaB